MVWINTSPTLQVSLVSEETPKQIISIANTQLVALLSDSELLIYHSQTFLPLASHKRSENSVQQHGVNLKIKFQLTSVNTAKRKKASYINALIHTSCDYLIVYQLQVSYSNSLFEVIDGKSDEILQSGLPYCITKSSFSMSNLIKSATKSIIVGKDAHIGMENIEHFGNSSVDDEQDSCTIPSVKVFIHKTLKVSIGVSDYWLKFNSYNFSIYNNLILQVINLKSLNVEMISFQELEWFKPIAEQFQGNVSVSEHLSLFYNEFANYYILLVQNDIWKLQFINQKLNGKIVGKLDEVSFQSYGNKFIFHPHCDLVLVQQLRSLKLYKFDNEGKFVLLKNIKSINYSFNNIKSVQWSPDGEYFVIIDDSTWLMFSKYGNCHFNSMETFKETKTHSSTPLNLEFLAASLLSITPNARNIITIESNKMFKFELVLPSNLSNNGGGYSLSNLAFTDPNYISIIDIEEEKLVKFPILPLFKNIMRQEAHINPFTQNHRISSGRLQVSVSKDFQMCLSYGEHLSISTPFQTGGKTNHILWFNFQNFIMDPFNFVNHLWTKDGLLILVHQNIVEKNEKLSLEDEIIIIDVLDSKYGHSGNGFKFDSDRIVWRQSLDDKIVAIDLSNDNDLIIITSGLILLKFKIVSLHTQVKLNTVTTINLKHITSRINVQNISQVKLINPLDFLILMNTGDLYILKKHSENESLNKQQQNKDTIFDLVLIDNHVEFFGFTKIKYDFLWLFNGDATLLHRLEDIVKRDESKLEKPIIIRNDLEYFQPSVLKISANSLKNRSIHLFGMECSSILKNNKYLIMKTRVNHKLILNDFIEYYIRNDDAESINFLMEEFESFNYCLELLLFKYLTNIDDNQDTYSVSKSLGSIIKLIDNTQQRESIYINCLRKIEVGYWQKFFDTLKTTPLKFMNNLIEKGQEELCHNYLIIYLNFKKEYESNNSKKATALIDSQDETIILKIINLLSKANRWDWCFELCRFIKILEPSSKLLTKIEKEIVLGKDIP